MAEKVASIVVTLSGGERRTMTIDEAKSLYLQLAQLINPPLAKQRACEQSWWKSVLSRIDAESLGGGIVVTEREHRAIHESNRAK